MGYFVGTDEAGYGPNLGPLIISATVWWVPDGVSLESLYDRVSHVIAHSKSREAESPRVVMADSKVLYKSGKQLWLLERGLLAAMDLLGRRPGTWRELFHSLDPNTASEHNEIPWYASYEAPVPTVADPGESNTLGKTLRDGLEQVGVQLVDIRSRTVFAREFNELLTRFDSKGAMLSFLTLELIAQILKETEFGPVQVVCDKHGGRNRYGRLLREHFPEYVVEVYGESRERSVYRFGPAERRVQVRFQMMAEALLPAALASMASKYLREQAMRAFNSFWAAHLPGIRATAGYPKDAKRFRIDIADKQKELGISDAILWRSR